MTRVRYSLSLLSILAIGLVAAFARAETLRNPYRIPTGIDPASVYVADFNGDGVPDILWGDNSQNPFVLHMLFGQGGGVYLPGPTLTLPANVSPYCRTLDANNDGITDLVCAEAETFSASLLTFLGNGDGTFQAPKYSTLPTSNGNYFDPEILPPLNLNSDLYPDLIVADILDERSYVLLGDGAGGFTVASTVSDIAPTQAVDVNGDGKPDLLLQYGPAVMLGNGDGTFQSSTFYGGLSPNTCVYRDMDGDGHADAVCGADSTVGGDINGGSFLLIYHGNPDGSFNTMPIVKVMYGDHSNEYNGFGTYQYPLALLDVNNDGIVDILAYAGDGFTVLLGQPSLKFANPVHYAAGYVSIDNFESAGIFTHQFVDLNGDGLPDVVAAGPNGIYISYAKQDGTFDTAPAYEVTENIGYETVADFNEDGIPDIAATGDQNIELNLGNGDGTFQPRIALPNGDADFSTPLSATNAHILHGDFNGDHHQDIIAIGSSSIYQYDNYILFGNGDGTFSIPQLVPDTSTLYPMYVQTAVADINRDGLDDILTGDLGHLYSALSKGDGTFTTITMNVPTDSAPNGAQGQTVAVLADFNRDGKLDAVYGAGTNVYVLQGHGDGSFDPTGTALPIPATNGSLSGGSTAVTTGDFDGDGNQDIALLVGSAAFVYYGNGDGAFTAGALISTFNRGYTGIYSADLNKDGLSDLILKTSGTLGDGYAVGVVHSQKGRTFGPEVNYYAGSGLADLSIADLNNDGFPDLVFSNGDYNVRASSATVLMNLGNTATVTGTLTAAPEPSYVGQPFNVTATLVPSGPATLTGPVEFYIDGTDLGAAQLIANTATFNVTGTFAVGVHGLSAYWAGGSTASALTLQGSHTITLPATHLSLVGSPNPANVGVPVTFTATITASGSTPGGMIVFSDGNTVLASVPLQNGVSAFTTSTLATGNHTITASYSANDSFAGSSATLTEVIISYTGDFSLTVTPGKASVYTGESASFEAEVTPTGGFNSPLGFSCSGLPAETTCLFTPSTFPDGQGESTLVVQTAAPHKATSANSSHRSPWRPGRPVMLLSACLFLFFARSRLRRGIFADLLAVFVILGGIGCANNAPITGGTPPGTYTIAVTAQTTGAARKLTHSSVITVTVKSLF